MVEAQKPSVGRIVHYVSYGTPNGEYNSVCCAAVVTEVREGLNAANGIVGLCILNPTGQFFTTNVWHDDEKKLAGTWHWPERT